jgi:hypothetical protein
MAHDGDEVVIVETIVNRAILGLTLSIMAANYACLSFLRFDFGSQLALLILWCIQTGFIFSLTIALCCWLGCYIEDVVCRAGAWYYQGTCDSGDVWAVGLGCSGYVVYPLMVTLNLPSYIIEAILLFVHIENEEVMAKMVLSVEVFWWLITMAGGFAVFFFLSYVLVHSLVTILNAVFAIFENCAVALSRCGRAMVHVLINCCRHREQHVDENSGLFEGNRPDTTDAVN